jgi:hypothetical protein
MEYAWPPLWYLKTSLRRCGVFLGYGVVSIRFSYARLQGGSCSDMRRWTS